MENGLFHSQKIYMKEFLKNKPIEIIFAVIGAIGGFLYWKFIGCTNGTCAIQSSWYWSTLWGMAAGYLLGDFAGGLIKRRKGKKSRDE
ncbi:hypothetical protein MNBD_BACTEROID01-2335 [hydrothermal vent metagenome]|uniref:Uncharacterized protein n=1 Tax=hydrothermal vent metagenome TaxID=652676 RepID=A0A3B0TGM1_9ZZZZ